MHSNGLRKCSLDIISALDSNWGHGEVLLEGEAHSFIGLTWLSNNTSLNESLLLRVLRGISSIIESSLIEYMASHRSRSWLDLF